MQQSEASKVALFDMAQYGWKQWQSAEEAEQINDMAFNFESIIVSKKAVFQRRLENSENICVIKIDLHMSLN